MDVTLHRLNEPGLAELLAAAVAGAEPAEVMAAPHGATWDDALRAGFVAFHRARSLGPDPVESTWVVRVDGVAAGAVRLEPARPGPAAGARGAAVTGDGPEVGLWLGRGHRGHGVGRSAVLAAAAEAATAGWSGPLVARTTAGNAGALGLLRALGAPATGPGDAAGPDGGTGPEGAVTARIPHRRSWGRSADLDTVRARPID